MDKYAFNFYITYITNAIATSQMYVRIKDNKLENYDTLYFYVLYFDMNEDQNPLNILEL